MDPQAAFLSNLDTIERITAAVCRRHAVSADEREEFASYVNLRLVDQNYAVFAKFRSQSSMSTYLTMVITNIFRDFRVAQWGRWRPAAETKRLGTVAIRLERLLYRDGYSLKEAFEVLRSAGGPLPSDLELRRLAARIPLRSRVRTVDQEGAEEPSAPDTADADVERHKPEQARARTFGEVEQALRTLPEEDQLILRLRFLEGFTVADIARTLHVEQKPLYARIQADLDRLRSDLEERGVSRERVAMLLSE